MNENGSLVMHLQEPQKYCVLLKEAKQTFKITKYGKIIWSNESLLSLFSSVHIEIELIFDLN